MAAKASWYRNYVTVTLGILDTIRYEIFTDARKLTDSQHNLPDGNTTETRKLEKDLDRILANPNHNL